MSNKPSPKKENLASSIASQSQQKMAAASSVADQAQRIVETALPEGSKLRGLLVDYISMQQGGQVDKDEFLQTLAQLMYFNPDKSNNNEEHVKLFKAMGEAFRLPFRSLGYLKEVGLYRAIPVVEDKQNEAERLAASLREKNLNQVIFKTFQHAWNSIGSGQQASIQGVSENKQLAEIASFGKDVYQKDLKLVEIFKKLHEAKIFEGYDKETTTSFILAIIEAFSTKLVDMEDAACVGYIEKLLSVVQALKGYQVDTQDSLFGYLSNPEKTEQILQQKEQEKEKEELAKKTAAVTPKKKEGVFGGKSILAALGMGSKSKSKEDDKETPKVVSVTPEKKDNLSDNDKGISAASVAREKSTPKKDDKEVRSSVLSATPLINAKQLPTWLQELETENSDLVLGAFMADSPEDHDPAESKSKFGNKKDNVAAEAIKSRLSAQIERIKQIIPFIGEKDVYKRERTKTIKCFGGLLEAAHARARSEVGFLKAKESAANINLLDKALEMVKEKEFIGRAKWLLNLTAEIDNVYVSLKVSAASSKHWPKISEQHEQLQALMQEIPGKYKEQPASNATQNSSSSSVPPQNSLSSARPRASSVPDNFWALFHRASKQPAGDKGGASEKLFSVPPAEGTKLSRRSSTGSSEIAKADGPN